MEAPVKRTRVEAIERLNELSVQFPQLTIVVENEAVYPDGILPVCPWRFFTAGGHFVVVYSYDENGFKVNDPKCVYRSRLSWSYEELATDIKQIWVVGE